MLRLIIFFVCYAIVFSCTMRKEIEDKEAILYKQSTDANDASFSFEKKNFWKINFEDNSFVMQKFSKIKYAEVNQKVKTFKFISNNSPEYYNNVNFAFVLYDRSKENDTMYYDGYNKWWIIEKGKTYQYEDDKNFFTEKLKMFYPIFRNCSYNTVQ